jgi:hypothetical protein
LATRGALASFGSEEIRVNKIVMRNNRDRSALIVSCGVLLLLFGCGESKTRDTVAVSVAPLSAAGPGKPVSLGREDFERALAPRLSRSAKDLEKHSTPLGGGRIDLRNRFQHVSIVRKRPDGTAESICVTSSGELHAALNRGTQAASP